MVISEITIGKKDIVAWFKELQDNICRGLEEFDGQGKFKEDLWTRKDGGGGRTRIIQGQYIEKGGVNFSEVFGSMIPAISKKLDIPSGQYLASGVSIVLHPKNPWVPIIHMNVRYFEMNDQIWWFGGGIDLTPHYILKEKAIEFHKSLKKICDRFHFDAYPNYKKWADDYFYIPHRNETRGIGGIFFDRLGDREIVDQEIAWQFVKDIGSNFVDIYKNMATDLVDKPFDYRNKEWQKLRRGRYVEFNLVYDRGTKFGLQTGGRIESILMSLPKEAQWNYDHHVAVGSEEYKTLELLKKEIDWINMEV